MLSFIKSYLSNNNATLKITISLQQYETRSKISVVHHLPVVIIKQLSYIFLYTIIYSYKNCRNDCEFVFSTITLISDCTITLISDCTITLISDCAITLISDCTITLISDCSITLISDCTITLISDCAITLISDCTITLISDCKINLISYCTITLINDCILMRITSSWRLVPSVVTRHQELQLLSAH